MAATKSSSRSLSSWFSGLSTVNAALVAAAGVTVVIGSAIGIHTIRARRRAATSTTTAATSASAVANVTLPPLDEKLGPRPGFVTCVSKEGTHKMAYVEWGDAKNTNIMICVHGLTRNGRDFDWLARYFAPKYRVICVDIVGRGKSDNLKSPDCMYCTFSFALSIL
jgi:hypothetical protein